MFVPSDLYTEAEATAQTGVGGSLHGALVGLFTNNVAPSPGNVIGDFTEPIFNGYARVAITWGATFRASDGTIRKSSQLVSFQPTDALHPQSIIGYFVADATGLIYYGGDVFPAPVPLPDALSRLDGVLDWIFTHANQAGLDSTN